MPSALALLARVRVIGAPMSRVSRAANSSMSRSTRSASFSSIAWRCAGLNLDHGPSNASRAAVTARSMSSASPSATWARISPVAGLRVSNVLPDAASSHLPPISMRLVLPSRNGWICVMTFIGLSSPLCLFGYSVRAAECPSAAIAGRGASARPPASGRRQGMRVDRPGRATMLQRCCNGLDFSVVVENFGAHFAAPAGLLVAAERQRGVEHVVAVDPHRSGANPAGQLVRHAAVGSPDACGEPVDCVVGALGDDLDVIVVERRCTDHRPEDFLLNHLHVGGGFFEHRGRHEVTKIANPLATCCDMGALTPAIFDVAGDAGELFVRYERAHLGLRVQARTNLDLPGDVGDP